MKFSPIRKNLSGAGEGIGLVGNMLYESMLVGIASLTAGHLFLAPFFYQNPRLEETGRGRELVVESFFSGTTRVVDEDRDGDLDYSIDVGAEINPNTFHRYNWRTVETRVDAVNPEHQTKYARLLGE